MRLRKILFSIPVVILLLLGLLLFGISRAVLPGLLEPVILKVLGDVPGCEIRLGEISIHPVRLKATVTDLALYCSATGTEEIHIGSADIRVRSFDLDHRFLRIGSINVFDAQLSYGGRFKGLESLIDALSKESKENADSSIQVVVDQIAINGVKDGPSVILDLGEVEAEVEAATVTLSSVSEKGFELAGTAPSALLKHGGESRRASPLQLKAGLRSKRFLINSFKLGENQELLVEATPTAKDPDTLSFKAEISGEPSLRFLGLPPDLTPYVDRIDLSGSLSSDLEQPKLNGDIKVGLSKLASTLLGSVALDEHSSHYSATVQTSEINLIDNKVGPTSVSLSGINRDLSANVRSAIADVQINGSLSISDFKKLEGEFHIPEINLRRLNPPLQRLLVTGEDIRADLKLTGDLTNPIIKGTISQSSASLIDFNYTKEGGIDLNGSLFNGAVKARLKQTQLGRYRLELAAEDLEMTKVTSGLTRAGLGEFAEDLNGRLTASYKVDGPLELFPFGEGDLTVSKLYLRRGNTDLVAHGDIRANITPNAINLKPAILSTNKGELNVHGQWNRPGDLNFAIAGAASVAAIVGKLEGIENVDGLLGLNVKLTGDIKEPQLAGEISLKDGSLIFPLGNSVVGFTGGKALVSFAGDDLTVKNATADFGGARISGEGGFKDIFSRELLAGSIDLHFKDVISEPVPGLTLNLNGTLSLKKEHQQDMVLAGDIAFGRSGYSRSISLASLVRSIQDLLVPRRLSPNVSVQRPEDEEESLKLALKFRSARGFTIDTTVVRGELEGDLDLKGELNDPLATGVVRAVNGEFSLGRKKFSLDTAEAIFTGESGVNPQLRIVAETDVRGREGEVSQAQLIVSGRLDSPKVKMLSNSGLSQNEILAQLGASSGVNIFGDSDDTRTGSKLFGLLDFTTPLDVGEKLSELIGLKEVQVGSTLTPNGEAVPEVTAIRPLKGPLSIALRSQFSKNQESSANLVYAMSENTSVFGGVRTGTPSRQDEATGESVEAGFQRKRNFGGFGLLGWLGSGDAEVKPDSVEATPAKDEISVESSLGEIAQLRLLFEESVQSQPIESDLNEELTRFVGRDRTDKNIREAKLRVLKILREKGYLQASVEDLSNEHDLEERIVTFQIALRSPFSISFAGNKVISADDLLQPLQMDSRIVPFSPGSISSLESEIRTLYQRLGYYYVKTELSFSDREGGGTNYLITISEGPQISVSDVQFSGNNGIEEEKIHSILAVKPRGSFFLRAWFSGRIMDAMLESDLIAIKRLYAEKGFFSTAVRADVQPSTVPEEVQVRYLIDEGPRSKISSIKINYSGDPNTRDAVLTLLSGSGVGDYFDAEMLERDKTRVFTIMRGLFGFADGGVNYRFDPSTGILVWNIESGHVVTIDKIEIEGNQNVSDLLLRRELTFREGDVLTEKRVERSVQNLFESGLVRSVQIEGKAGQSAADKNDIVVKIKERDGGTAAGSITLNSEDGLHLYGEVTQRNLAASGNTLRLRADAFFKDSSSVVDAGSFGASLGIPHFGGSSGKLSLDTFADYSILLIDPYNFNRFGGRLTYDLPVREQQHLRFLFTEYRENLYDVPADIILDGDDIGINFFGGIGAEFDWDQRNDRFSPSSGNRFLLSANLFDSVLGSSADFLQLSLQDGLYLPNSPQSFWYLGLGARAAEPFSSTEVIPLSQRYFLGGRDTLRGFSRNVIGPRGEFGNIAGGDTSLVLNGEYHYRFTDAFEGLLFLDLGQSYLRNEGDFGGKNDDLGEFRYSPGLGVRFITPIGPLGVEYGVNPSPQNGERGGRLYFGIGGNF